MKVVKTLLTCECGFEMHTDIPLEKISPSSYYVFSLTCSNCNKRNLIAYYTKVCVLCEKGTNKPAIFDYEGEVLTDA